MLLTVEINGYWTLCQKVNCSHCRHLGALVYWHEMSEAGNSKWSRQRGKWHNVIIFIKNFFNYTKPFGASKASKKTLKQTWLNNCWFWHLFIKWRKTWVGTGWLMQKVKHKIKRELDRGHHGDAVVSAGASQHEGHGFNPHPVLSVFLGPLQLLRLPPSFQKHATWVNRRPQTGPQLRSVDVCLFALALQ